jgi:hypothetical protein
VHRIAIRSNFERPVVEHLLNGNIVGNSKREVEV